MSVNPSNMTCTSASCDMPELGEQNGSLAPEIKIVSGALAADTSEIKD